LEIEVSAILDEAGLDLMFRQARTHKVWAPEPVSEADIRAIYELGKYPPTSANTNPGRFVFVTSPAGKARLKPHLAPPNVEKTMTAPCCVIVAQDRKFLDYMPKLLPGMPTPFGSNPALAEETALRNSTLQGAYMMMAARALGFDVGPMSGFNRATLDAELFADGRWASNFLFNLGHGVPEKLTARNARLDFDESCILA
jgi:3-hydroxypropanoate dehydrogenase